MNWLIVLLILICLTCNIDVDMIPLAEVDLSTDAVVETVIDVVVDTSVEKLTETTLNLLGGLFMKNKCKMVGKGVTGVINFTANNITRFVEFNRDYVMRFTASSLHQ